MSGYLSHRTSPFTGEELQVKFLADCGEVALSH